jgi:uncharacterized protein YecT (DUF1311 family)
VAAILLASITIIGVGRDAQGRVGPSFECAEAEAAKPLEMMICNSAELSEADLRFVQTYQALREEVGEAGRSELRQEAIDFQKSVLEQCSVPQSSPVSGVGRLRQGGVRQAAVALAPEAERSGTRRGNSFNRPARNVAT